MVADGAGRGCPLEVREVRSLARSEVLMVVVMEWCDLGSLAASIRKQRFRPHGKWPFKSTYVRST